MATFYMPKIKRWVDNRIVRPTAKTEAQARRTGTAKRVGASMAAKFVRRMGS